MKRIGGPRRKTRHLFSKHKREKGKVSLTKYFQNFKQGEVVQLSAEPSIQKGIYDPRYYGRSGIIRGRKGRCYEVMIENGGKEKTLLVYPVHLKRG